MTNLESGVNYLSYSAPERETVLQCDDETKTWSITTLQPTVITKLKKANIEAYKVTEDGMHWYKGIDFNRISFRNESNRQPMTDEQRKAAADRLRRAREKK